jgi:hypothetical protein
VQFLSCSKWGNDKALIKHSLVGYIYLTFIAFRLNSFTKFVAINDRCSADDIMKTFMSSCEVVLKSSRKVLHYLENHLRRRIIDNKIILYSFLERLCDRNVSNHYGFLILFDFCEIVCAE